MDPTPSSALSAVGGSSLKHPKQNNQFPNDNGDRADSILRDTQSQLDTYENRRTTQGVHMGAQCGIRQLQRTQKAVSLSPRSDTFDRLSDRSDGDKNANNPFSGGRRFLNECRDSSAAFPTTLNRVMITLLHMLEYVRSNFGTIGEGDMLGKGSQLPCSGRFQIPCPPSLGRNMASLGRHYVSLGPKVASLGRHMTCLSSLPSLLSRLVPEIRKRINKRALHLSDVTGVSITKAIRLIIVGLALLFLLTLMHLHVIMMKVDEERVQLVPKVEIDKRFLTNMYNPANP